MRCRPLFAMPRQLLNHAFTLVIGILRHRENFGLDQAFFIFPANHSHLQNQVMSDKPGLDFKRRTPDAVDFQYAVIAPQYR